MGCSATYPSDLAQGFAGPLATVLQDVAAFFEACRDTSEVQRLVKGVELRARAQQLATRLQHAVQPLQKEVMETDQAR